MAKDIHASKFEQNTLHKLWLYEQYLLDALPVFLKHPSVKEINLFDFFAGPGYSEEGDTGSPAIAVHTFLQTLAGIDKGDKRLHLFFNEKDKGKFEKLLEYCNGVKSANPVLDIHVFNEDFQELYPRLLPIMESRACANLVFIDQYGLSYVSKEVFQSLASLRFTDFMFFLASASANRFKEDKALWSHLPPLTDEEKAGINNKNVHRVLASSYKRWIPQGAECYLANFSFQRQSNVYGLVFGSGHPLGLDKFLHKAWKLAAEYGGQADYDIDEDGISKTQPFLYPDWNKPTKLQMFEQELSNKLQSHSFTSNVEIYLFSLEFGVLPAHARQTIKELINDKTIPRQTIPISHDCLKNPKPIQY